MFWVYFWWTVIIYLLGIYIYSAVRCDLLRKGLIQHDESMGIAHCAICIGWPISLIFATFYWFWRSLEQPKAEALTEAKKHNEEVNGLAQARIDLEKELQPRYSKRVKVGYKTYTNVQLVPPPATQYPVLKPDETKEFPPFVDAHVG